MPSQVSGWIHLHQRQITEPILNSYFSICKPILSSYHDETMPRIKTPCLVEIQVKTCSHYLSTNGFKSQEAPNFQNKNIITSSLYKSIPNQMVQLAIISGHQRKGNLSLHFMHLIISHPYMHTSDHRSRLSSIGV